MISSDRLKANLRKLSKEKNISAQELLQIFMFERLIERLSMSKFRYNMVLKGGLLVASMIGIDERTTMDMDTTIVNYPVTEESMEAMIREIISIDIDDGVDFKFIKLNSIRKSDEYNNYSISIEASYERLRVPLKIDITTGDKITPKEIEYEYYLSFEDKNVLIFTYPLETILAEKLETILSRGITNTRARDFYDIYLLNKTKGDEIRWGVLQKALIETATHRESIDEIYDFDDILNEIEQSEIVLSSWLRYQEDNSYAQNIEFSIVFKVLKLFLKQLENGSN